MKLNFTTLIYFKKIVKHKNITKAAKELNIAQSSLSRTIKNLEKELKVPLLMYNGYEMLLTPYGEKFLSHANTILNEISVFQKEITMIEKHSQKTVSLSIRSASKLLPEFLSQFKIQYPEINIKIYSVSETSISDHSKDIVDLEIYSAINPKREKNTISLFTEPLLLAVPSSSSLATMKETKLKDFKEHKFICSYPNQALREIVNYYCKKVGFNPQIAIESDSPETISEFIRVGLGIALIPKITWSRFCNSEITLIPISDPVCTRDIMLKWKNSDNMSDSALLLKNYICNNFPEYAHGNLIISNKND
jgi:hypothetical protein